MAKDAIYQGSREVKTFVDLTHGATVLIKMAETEKKGSYYTTMSALLFSAFTFEAYLNHLGDKTLKFWSEIESIKVMDKYAVLCKHFRIVSDFSGPPHQTLVNLFKFRNEIAHGKSKILEVTKVVSSQDELHDHSPKSHWEEYCTLENAKRAKEDVEKVIKELHQTAGLGNYPFTFGLGSGSLSLKPLNTALKGKTRRS